MITIKPGRKHICMLTIKPGRKHICMITINPGRKHICMITIKPGRKHICMIDNLTRYQGRPTHSKNRIKRTKRCITHAWFLMQPRCRYIKRSITTDHGERAPFNCLETVHWRTIHKDPCQRDAISLQNYDWSFLSGQSDFPPSLLFILMPICRPSASL